MSETGRPGQVRVGDAERNAAVAALGEHMSSGRLDLTEYGDRSARAGAACTDTELQALFADLPAPHPPVAGALSPTTPASVIRAPAAAAARPAAAPADGEVSRAQRVFAGLMGVIALVAVGAFFLLDHFFPHGESWLVFLIVPLAGAVGSAVWGKDWRHR